MKKAIVLLVLVVFSVTRPLPSFAQYTQFVDYVNPFIGTADANVKLKFLAYNFGGGNTYPGAVTPWGMTAISPRNTLESPNPGDFSASPSGYVYGKEYIYGFSQIHLSGVGCNEWGNILVMPTVGEISTDFSINRSRYSYEFSTPGYYSVLLNNFDIMAEVSATTRTTIAKFTSQKKTDRFNIIVDLYHAIRAAQDGYIRVLSDVEIEGWSQNGGFCGIDSQRKVFFVARFSKPAKSSGTFNNDTLCENIAEQSGPRTGSYLQFEMENEEALYVSIGVSFVSISNARLNLQVEQFSRNFERIKKEARHSWDSLLSRIQVEGGTHEQKVMFYTALYHALIHPSIYSDVNGDYIAMGSHGVKKLPADRKNQYNVYSLWDTYRNLHPLLTLVYPEVQLDMVKTMVDQSIENGFLPKWELSGDETYVMTGDPACIVIADTYGKGLKDFDVETAFNAMVKSSTQLEGNKVRPGLAQYLKHGYIPEDRPGEWVWGSVATSLEYYLADWSIGQLAKTLGKDSISGIYQQRSLGYKHYYEPLTRFLRPKKENGSWHIPFNPDSIKGSIPNATFPCGGVGYTEGNAWQYNFFVPHDITGLIGLMGRENFLRRLNECFEQPDRFVLFNEPDMAYPYLYTYLDGQAWRTQELVRKSLDQYFSAGPGGLPGNDDCGTTSSWLIFSSMGFYPACPASTRYQIGSPVFDKTTIRLQPQYYPGDKFIITTRYNSDVNRYIQKMVLNRKEYKEFSIEHSDITRGGRLEVEMGNTPERTTP